MIGYQVAEARDNFRNQLMEEMTVTGREEHVLPGVAAQDDVVQTAGNVKTGLAGHASILQRSSQYATYQA